MPELQPTSKVPPMDRCPRCRGHGLVHGIDGEPTDCYDCGGGGQVPARDDRGRFLPWTDQTTLEGGEA